MKIRFITPVLLLLAMSFSSCVAKKKLTAANQQISELNAKNQDLTNNLASAQSDLRTISVQYRDFKKDCEALATRYRVASTVLNDQAEDLEKVRGKLSDALIDFENRGVEVFYRDGEVHVSMADKLLYKSGSSKLGNDGIEALGKVAEVLNAYPNLRVVVMGNTDDVQ